MYILTPGKQIENSPHAKSLSEKVHAKTPQNHTDELLLAITPPPMGKTTRRELSPIEKGMIIAFFWFFFRKISIFSLITGSH